MDIKEDIKDFNTFHDDYMDLKSNDIATAETLLKKAWALAARWNTLQLCSNKIDITQNKTKTDISKWCGNNYQLLKEAYIHCRQIFNTAKGNLKYQANE